MAEIDSVVLRESEYIKILVCGKTGCGKSSLINSVFGTDAPVSDPGESGVLEPGTTEVNHYDVELNGVNVIVYDTPGLQDGTDRINVYLKNMHDECKEVDLVLYCIDITNDRFGNDDKDTVKLIAQTFADTPRFWKHCILVLTKANRVWTKPQYGEREKFEYHKKRFHAFVSTFLNELRKYIEIGNIPAVATGHSEDPNEVDDCYLYYVSEAVEKESQGRTVRFDFLPELMATCICFISGEAQSYFCTSTDFTYRLVNKDERLMQSIRERNELERTICKKPAVLRARDQWRRSGNKIKLNERQIRIIQKAFDEQNERLKSYANFGHNIGVAVGGVLGTGAGLYVGVAGLGAVTGGALGGAVGGLVGQKIGEIVIGKDKIEPDSSLYQQAFGSDSKFDSKKRD